MQETETSAGSMGFGNSVTTDTNKADKAAYEDTVSNFGTTFAYNSTVFQNISEANHQMSENVASNINNLQKSSFPFDCNDAKYECKLCTAYTKPTEEKCVQ